MSSKQFRKRSFSYWTKPFLCDAKFSNASPSHFNYYLTGRWKLNCSSLLHYRVYHACPTTRWPHGHLPTSRLISGMSSFELLLFLFLLFCLMSFRCSLQATHRRRHPPWTKPTSTCMSSKPKIPIHSATWNWKRSTTCKSLKTSWKTYLAEVGVL